VIEFFRNQLLPSKPAQLVILTIVKWQKDECLEMGAALAYYALLSLFPLLLVILSILGYVLGPETETFNLILTFFQQSLPPAAAHVVEDSLLQLNQRSIQAGIVGVFLVVFTASGVFAALDRSVDKIWRVDQTTSVSTSLSKAALSFIGQKLLAFFLVASTSAVLLFSLLSKLVISGVMEFVSTVNTTIPFLEIDELVIAEVLHSSTSFLLVALATLLLLRFLPSTPTPWKDLWPGAMLTTLLLIGLQQLISHSIIEIGAQYQSYGVIGGVMTLMLWIYLTCQIFFLGCEFSYVYAHLCGSRRCHRLEM
jgi:membrane protein